MPTAFPTNHVSEAARSSVVLLLLLVPPAYRVLRVRCTPRIRVAIFPVLFAETFSALLLRRATRHSASFYGLAVQGAYVKDRTPHSKISVVFIDLAVVVVASLVDVVKRERSLPRRVCDGRSAVFSLDIRLQPSCWSLSSCAAAEKHCHSTDTPKETTLCHRLYLASCGKASTSATVLNIALLYHALDSVQNRGMESLLLHKINLGCWLNFS